VKVIETIVGFQKRHIVHDKVIEESTLQLPPTEYDTCAIVSGPTPLTCRVSPFLSFLPSRLRKEIVLLPCIGGCLRQDIKVEACMTLSMQPKESEAQGDFVI
jgi:hypothetical protein